MNRKSKFILLFSTLIFILLASYTIINYMNCLHEDACSEHILTTSLKEGKTEEGDLLWELKYEKEVDDIIKNMDEDTYKYPISVDQLKTLNYLYCRGHKVYLRGTGTNTITRTGSLSGSDNGNSYEISVKTGLTGPLGTTEKVEVDSYEFANTDLTFNEWVQHGTDYRTTSEIYTGKELFVIPGINGDPALINDDHACDGKESQYRYNIEPIKMDSMSRFKVKKEANNPESEVGNSVAGEPLYTDEDEALYMAYDAAKAYIYTVVKGGHYGIGQLASWRLRDNLGFWQDNAEYEIHDGIGSLITEEQAIEVLGLVENLYQITEITSTKVEIKEDNEHPGTDITPPSDEYQEETMDYEESLEDGQAGVLYQEALAMARHVYSTETFKESHNDNLIADCTDKDNLNVNYVKNGDYYLVGPFTLEYVRSVMQSKESPIPEVAAAEPFSLGGLTEAKLTYTTMAGTEGTLTVDSSKSEFEFVVTGNKVDRGEIDTTYKFPYPAEQFYLKIPYQGTDEKDAIKTLNKIEYTLDNTYAKGQVYNLEGRYCVITWDDNIDANGKEYIFECEEEATICETHHTSNSHCDDDCEAEGCYGHDEGTSDCDLEIEYYIDDGDDCGGHGYWASDGEGNRWWEDLPDCTGHTSCNDDITLCDTHHEVVGTSHARNKAYWIQVTNVSELQKAQPLMWMRNAGVYRRTYTATSEFEVDMTMDFGGFVWVDAYTNTDDIGEYTGDNVYDPEKTALSGYYKNDILKEGVEVYLLKVAKAAGATGTAYVPENGDNSTVASIGETSTGYTYYYAEKPGGGKITATTGSDGKYSFDEIPVLKGAIYEGYVVAFVYDGQSYESVEALYKKSDDGTTQDIDGYVTSADKTAFYNSSMATEDDTERENFNKKFEEIYGKEDINITEEKTIGSATQVPNLEYESKKGSEWVAEQTGDDVNTDYLKKEFEHGKIVSIAVTDGEGGVAIEGMKMDARTSETSIGNGKGLIYPLTDVYNIRLVDKQTTSLSGTNVTTVTTSGEISHPSIEAVYDSAAKAYTANINLGLIIRPQADISVTKDLYSARTVIKGNDMTYAYGEALRNEEAKGYGLIGTTGSEWPDTNKVQEEIMNKNIFYNLYIYKSDYEYNSAVEYIAASDAIKEVRMGRYATISGYADGNTLLYNASQSAGGCLVCGGGSGLCNKHKAQGYDSELRTYLTYKITLRNEGATSVLAEINKLLDYHDDSLEIVTEDIYAVLNNGEDQMLDKDGKPNIQVVASPSQYYYYKMGNLNETAEIEEDGTITAEVEYGDVVWNNLGTEQGAEIDKNATTAQSVTYVKEQTASLDGIKLAKNEKIEIYVTYRVKEKDTKVEIANVPQTSRGGSTTATMSMPGSTPSGTGTNNVLNGDNGFGECGRIILGDKYNIAEVSNYTTYKLKEGSTSEYMIYGRVDKDSAPDNIELQNGDKANYDDDGDAAPPITIDLLKEGKTSNKIIGQSTNYKEDGNAEEEEYSRTITGIVWEDERTENITEYQQLVGDGRYDESSEVGIEGVTVQLIEKVQTMDGTEEDYLAPDVKQVGAGYNPADPINDTPDCIAKFETKTDSEGRYVFEHIPAGTYVVRFIYGSEKLETQYAKMSADADVTYGTGENKITVKAGDMPQIYNGQDFKSTSYQVNIDNDSDDDGYIDNEWDENQLSTLAERVSDARDNEVRRLENIAYSRTVNNKVATELDALTTNDDEMQNYEFSIGVLNGVPTVMISSELQRDAGISNPQVQQVMQDADGNYTISENMNLIHQNDMALPNVMQYTWMYADTAKIIIAAENKVVTEEMKASETFEDEYINEVETLTRETLDSGANAVDLAKLMFKTITHSPRVIEVADIDTAAVDLSKAAMIYKVLPGQITVDDKSNFGIGESSIETKYTTNNTDTSGYSKTVKNYPGANKIYNIDFGIEERPKNSVELEKWVSSLELKLSDGRILFNIPFKPEYNPETGIYDSVIDEENCISDVYDTSSKEGRDGLLAHLQSQDSVKYFGKEGIAQGFIYVNMDEELLQGATITVGYGMMVTNTSEVDTVGLLSFFDDGDTIMQLANYIREASEKNMTTPFIGSTIGSLGNLGTSFLSDVRKKYETEKTAAVAAVTTEIEKQFISAKYDNVISRLKSAEDKLINLMAGDVGNVNNFEIASVQNLKDQMNGYIINNPTIDNSNDKKTTPYGLFVGTTYYTGAAATGSAKVYAVESKVEQIIDYVDNQLGADDSKLMALNGSWAKLDITALFGNYVQNNVLNSINPSGISNEGTLINIFESAVITFSEELLNKIDPSRVTWDDSSKDIEGKYRQLYQDLLRTLAQDNSITLRELIHSLGDEGVKLLSNIYTSSDATVQGLLEVIISGLTVTDNEGNSYITMSLNDLNELRNNVLITINDKERNPSLGTYLVPEKVAKETSNLYGTNDGYGVETATIEGTTIKDAVGGNKQYSANVNLVAQKTVSATALAEEIEDMVFNNAAEIVQISNKVGRKDKMAVAGNLLIGEGEWESTTGSDPSDGDPITKRITAILTTPTPIMPEYDSAATARIIFSPPTGQGFLKLISNDIFQGGLIGLIIVALGIVVIKVVFFKKKKIYK